VTQVYLLKVPVYKETDSLCSKHACPIEPGALKLVDTHARDHSKGPLRYQGTDPLLLRPFRPWRRAAMPPGPVRDRGAIGGLPYSAP
jgi:hypothetical protein